MEQYNMTGKTWLELSENSDDSESLDFKADAQHDKVIEEKECTEKNAS